MKAINQDQEQSIGPFFDMIQGVIEIAVLRAVFDSGICDILETDSLPQHIAKRMSIKTNATNLCYFLDAAVSLGFIDKKDGRYFNNPFGKTYLCQNSPTYMGNLVKNLSDLRHKNLNTILDLVTNGPPEIKSIDRLQSEQTWKRSFRHLISYQKAGAASAAADLLESLPEFKNATTLLDLGCGPGYVCMEAMKRNPRLKGNLFDLPDIIKEAEKEIEKEGFADRVKAIAGNYNECSLGGPYDIIWACQSLYYVNNPADFYKKLYESLSPQGVFLSLHEGLTNENTHPRHIVLSRLSLALEGQDVSFEKGRIESYLLQAGFGVVESKPVPFIMGELELTVARKKGV